MYASYIDTTTYGSTTGFYIELFNAGGTSVALSEVISKSALSSFVTQGASLAEVPKGAYGFSAAPEPTSGLMMLLGMAMLGLRRRKVA